MIALCLSVVVLKCGSVASLWPFLLNCVHFALFYVSGCCIFVTALYLGCYGASFSVSTWLYLCLFMVVLHRMCVIVCYCTFVTVTGHFTFLCGHVLCLYGGLASCCDPQSVDSLWFFLYFFPFLVVLRLLAFPGYYAGKDICALFQSVHGHPLIPCCILMISNYLVVTRYLIKISRNKSHLHRICHFLS